MNKFKHVQAWDDTAQNHTCFECGRNATNCDWLKNNAVPEGAVFYNGKIYLCPNLIINGEGIEDYQEYISAAYAEKCKEMRRLKTDLYRFRGIATNVRSIMARVDDIKKGLKRVSYEEDEE